MYVFRFFLSTLFLVITVAGSILGFIYRDDVMHKIIALSGGFAATLYERGWINTTDSVVKQESATIHQSVSTAPAPVLTPPVTDVMQVAADEQAAAVPVSSHVQHEMVSTNKADYPSNDEGNLLKHSTNSKSTVTSLDTTPLHNIPSVSESNSTVPYDNGQLHKDPDSTSNISTTNERREKMETPSYSFSQLLPSQTIPNVPSNNNLDDQRVLSTNKSSQISQSVSSLNGKSTPPFTDPSSVNSHANSAISSQTDTSRYQQLFRAKPSVALREEWIAARRAFWEQDQATAEKTYQTLIRNYPDEPDLPGELGNIYISQGRWQEAADLYYEAGIRALRTSSSGQASAVIRILRQLDPAKAEVLLQNMTASYTQ